MWYETLSTDEAAQWEKLLATCKGDEKWQAVVKSFQFAEKTPAKERLADCVKNLLIDDDEKEKE